SSATALSHSQGNSLTYPLLTTGNDSYLTIQRKYRVTYGSLSCHILKSGSASVSCFVKNHTRTHITIYNRIRLPLRTTGEHEFSINKTNLRVMRNSHHLQAHYAR
ncbi:hypothetical protein ACFLVM_03125, partial [Chloroflexota bacterium]